MIRKPFISAYAVFAILVLLLGCSQSAQEPIQGMDDLESAVSGLLSSPADDAFLIVTIPGTPDFVQLAGYRGSAELDFPQVTSRQKQLRPKVEAVCKELGLRQRITRAPNGTEFLDYELPNDAVEIAKILRKILAEVFDASEAAELEFETNGFEIPAI